MNYTLKYSDYFQGYPTVTPYGQWLFDQGLKTNVMLKPGIRQPNVEGLVSEPDPNRPIAVITYAPYKSERYFASFRDAMRALPEKGHYQVVNMITGSVLYEPYQVEHTDHYPRLRPTGLRRYYHV